MLTTPIAITNTHSVGVVRDALIASHPTDPDHWSLPVVGETWDGALNDINGFHVRPEHVFAAVESASGGPVPEGNVGGGTGMICHEFKGGTGTASRVLPEADGGYTVGVLVQANHGWRHRLVIEGVRVGREIPYERIPAPREKRPPGSGSIIGIGATDGRSSPASASGSHSASASASPEPAGPARIRAGTSSSPSRPATEGSPARSERRASRCSRTSASTPSSTPSSRRPRRRPSTPSSLQRR